MTCEFCKDTLQESIKDRTVAAIDNFLIVTPNHPAHEFHLLIFDQSVHVAKIHQFEDSRCISLKNLIYKLDAVFKKYLEGYQGYNMTSNNGSAEIGQHIQHAHIHLFMRFEDESQSPFVRLASGESLNVVDSMRMSVEMISRLKESA